ncbi:MAG: DivIVA domain-containing protein, partial [Nocardioidaceae bacterium]
MWFWVIVLVAIIGAVAMIAAGRGDSMAPVYDDRPDAVIPTGRPLTAADVRSVRLSTGLRGYRMDEVDTLIERFEADLLSRESRERGADGSSASQPADSAEPAETSEPARSVESAEPT